MANQDVSTFVATINSVDYKITDWDVKDKVETVDVPWIGAGDYADCKIKIRATGEFTLTLLGNPSALEKMTTYPLSITRGTDTALTKSIKITDIEDKGSATGANTFVISGYIVAAQS